MFLNLQQLMSKHRAPWLISETHGLLQCWEKQRTPHSTYQVGSMSYCLISVDCIVIGHSRVFLCLFLGTAEPFSILLIRSLRCFSSSPWGHLLLMKVIGFQTLTCLPTLTVVQCSSGLKELINYFRLHIWGGIQQNDVWQKGFWDDMLTF